MASKFSFHVNRLKTTVDGYQVDENLGLYLDPEDKLWRGCHLKTGEDLQGPSGRFKKKRACLAFIESFVDFDWDITSEQEMLDKNGGESVVWERYREAAQRAMELD